MASSHLQQKPASRQSAANAPIASIIVCTRDRAEMLREALLSIVGDGSLASREVIVVDNGSSDGTAEIVREVAAASEVPVRYVLEPTPGKSHALNRAVRLVRGEYLLFTDDDVLAEHGWADALIAGFSDPRVGAVGGRILPSWPFSPPEWMNGPHAERLTLPDLGAAPRELDSRTLPVGANMAIRASIAREFEGPFETELGPKGEMKLDSEEFMLLRAISKQHRLIYRPKALVLHRILPERIDWRAMRRSFFQLGFGLAREERLRGDASLSFPRRAVRAARVCRGARRTRRRNQRLPAPGPDEAQQEFFDYMWAGKHLEMAFGRFPRLAGWLAARSV